MAIDGFFIKHLIIELSNTLLNNRLERVNQLDENNFVLDFYLRGERSHLAIKLNAPNASIFLIDKHNKVETISSNFQKSLKKELEGAILTNIAQHKNDRVIIFDFVINDFLDGQVNKKLIFELMGRHNNLILTKDNIVIDAHSKRFSEKSRSIIPKIKYTFFPTNKLDLKTIDYNLFTTPNYLSKTYIGVSPLLSKFLFKNKINIFNITVTPTKDLDSNKFYWFDLFNDSNNKKHYPSLSLLLAAQIKNKVISTDKYNNFINKKLINIEKRINILEHELNKGETNLSAKLKGDIIYSSGLDLTTKTSHIKDFNNKIIKLDSTKTLNENAQHSYQIYHKAKRTIKTVTKLIKELINRKNDLLEISYFLSLDNANLNDIELELENFGYNAKRKRKSKKVDKPSEPLILNYKDTLIYVGKNSRQNNYITHSLANRSDYWLHVQNAPGSHVVVRSSNPNDDILIFAAMLAAHYSQLNYSNNVDVSYTQIKNLKKIPKRPGSQVILTSYQTIRVNVDNKLINDVKVANKLK